MTAKPIGIYIHIPFCASRCGYCDFCTTAGKDELIPSYQEALLRHIGEFGPRLVGYAADTVYFGGGTPSYYGADRLDALFDFMKRRLPILKSAEVTFEANPESLTKKDLRRLRNAGFNRVSIGAQSANDTILAFIGRRHKFEHVREAVANAREAGFDNISLDLIYGLPAQTREDWVDTLSRAMALSPRHISCYGLHLEEGAPLFRYSGSPVLPDDDLQADMYLYAVDALAAQGYVQYEISNFAQKGCESKHNLKYWQLGEYVGFGASASSDVGGRRFTCIADVEKYISSVMDASAPIITHLEEITAYERVSEYLMLGLRTVNGISEEEYGSFYQSSFKPIRELLEGYMKSGYARLVNGRWSLTPAGFLLSNQLIGELLDVQSEQKFNVGSPWRKEDYFTTLY